MNQQEMCLAEYHSAQGSTKAAAKDYQGAIHSYTKALELNAEGWVFFLRGETFLMMHQRDNALADFLCAIGQVLTIHHDYIDMCTGRSHSANGHLIT